MPPTTQQKEINLSEEKTGIDWPLERKAFRRVWRDLRWPGAIALVIALYNSTFTRDDWFKDVSFFFTTWFFAAAYFSYYQRSKKLVIDERNHTRVVVKQDAVITRLETLADELAGHSSGGDSYCYVSTVRTDPSSIIELKILLCGKYPLQGVVLGITDTFNVAEKFSKWQSTGSIEHILATDFTHRFETILPNVSYYAGCNLPFRDPGRIRLQLIWEAKNGKWRQHLQLEKCGEIWLKATTVHRDEVLIFAEVDDGYPLDPDGNPTFREYEHRLPFNFPMTPPTK